MSALTKEQIEAIRLRADSGFAVLDDEWNALCDMALRQLSGESAIRDTIPARLAPLCDEHGSGEGARSGCPYCALHRLCGALSKIDYMCGEPNEMECSAFDVSYNEDAVVENVKRRLAALAAAARDEREACAVLAESEICACCWTGDAQAAAEHIAEAIRARAGRVA
jgi:hypothetical protein